MNGLIADMVVLPYRFWRPEMKAERWLYCRDDELYVVNESGVHYFKYVGTNLHYGRQDGDGDAD